MVNYNWVKTIDDREKSEYIIVAACGITSKHRIKIADRQELINIIKSKFDRNQVVYTATHGYDPKPSCLVAEFMNMPNIKPSYYTGDLESVKNSIDEKKIIISIVDWLAEVNAANRNETAREISMKKILLDTIHNTHNFLINKNIELTDHWIESVIDCSIKHKYRKKLNKK